MSSNDEQQRQHYEEDNGSGVTEKVLGIVPAPELPEEMIQKIADDIPDYLSRYVDENVYWRVESVTDPLTGAGGGSEEILEEIEESKVKENWDFAICVTDLPIFEERYLVVADVSTSENKSVISLPALGSNPMKRRLLEAITQITNEMYFGSSEEAREEQERKTKEKSKKDDEVRKKGSKQLTSKRITERISPIKRKTFDDNVDVRYIVKSRFSGGIRLISGMVLANRPWTVFPSFKSVLAVAFTTGAYALIFPSLWRLSDTYETDRFIYIMITSILAMVVWIIIAHGLWEKPREGDSKFIVRRYNLATFSTLFLGVIVYYTVLFFLFLGAVSLLIPSELMEEELLSEIHFGNYVMLAWLATSVATIIGALGAGLESEETVLKATYGYRQRRRKREAQKRKEEENKKEESYDNE